MQTGFIVAIDLGSSEIRGIVGRMNENNVISVSESVSIPSDGCIRRGLVYNIEKTSGIVKKLINLLENKLQPPRKIGRVYVSLGGQSLHTEKYREMKQLTSSGIVTEEVIEQLRRKAEDYKPELNRKYAVADVEYFVDDRPENNPVGVTCSQIEAGFEILVGRPTLMINIKKSIEEKLGLPIVDYIVGPLASAAITLNDEEKQLGCAFVDFGAGTTTLSVYKDGILRHLAVIPFGGSTITKDICELNFVESDAEQYKTKFGKAKDNQDNGLFSPFSQKPEIDLVELNKVIRMRLDEITANLKEQIRLSGYEGQLGAGLIITGGASQLRNLDLYLTEKLKMPVRKASAKKTMVNNSPEIVNNPAMTQALGMLLFAKEDCEKILIEEAADGESDKSKSSWSFPWNHGQRNEQKKQIEELKKEEKRLKKLQERKEKEEKERKEKEHSNNEGGFLGHFFNEMFHEEDDEDEEE
ncbi:MAG: cell division protein FtsA [Dysgonamonadaceae bacterium]|jgi:cell division protein FtsA|nr:cell division protein FtsA [Dysgonamonadaceae bacterium]